MCTHKESCFLEHVWVFSHLSKLVPDLDLRTPETTKESLLQLGRQLGGAQLLIPGDEKGREGREEGRGGRERGREKGRRREGGRRKHANSDKRQPNSNKRKHANNDKQQARHHNM